jgi:hypothetical protein
MPRLAKVIGEAADASIGIERVVPGALPGR